MGRFPVVPDFLPPASIERGYKLARAGDLFEPQ